MNKWLVFINERFSPAVYIPTILLLVCSAFALMDIGLSPLRFVAVFLFTAIFLLKLRFYDEIKDYDTDVILNPTRPLPRGLIKVSEVKLALIFCVAAELLIFVSFGKSKYILTPVLAILYSLLMYKEFFIGKFLRDKLTTYAIMHTIVISMITLSAFSFLLDKTLFDLPLKCYYLALLNWPIFNLYEFARKTFASSEEGKAETYSSLFGRVGASALGLLQILFLIFLCYKYFLIDAYQIYLLCSGMALFVIVSVNYIVKNSVSSASLYRTTSQGLLAYFYIVLSLNLQFGVS